MTRTRCWRCAAKTTDWTKIQLLKVKVKEMQAILKEAGSQRRLRTCHLVRDGCGPALRSRSNKQQSQR